MFATSSISFCVMLGRMVGIQRARSGFPALALAAVALGLEYAEESGKAGVGVGTVSRDLAIASKVSHRTH
jgi:hypothetical protein